MSVTPNSYIEVHSYFIMCVCIRLVDDCMVHGAYITYHDVLLYYAPGVVIR